MRFFVTGANGYLGSRIYQDLKANYETYGSYHNEALFKELVRMDMGNEHEILRVIEKIRPEIIIHAAAIPTIKIINENPEHAERINVEGTSNLLIAADKVGAKVFYISTNGAAEPFDKYTQTKADSERLVENSNQYLILRPALILGGSPNTKNDRQQNRFIKNVLGTKEPVYDNSTKLQVTWIGHVSEVIALAAQRGIWNQTIPISAEERKTRFEIASDVLSPFGIAARPTTDKLGGFTPQSTEKLGKLGLPIYTYSQVIEKTVKELGKQVSLEEAKSSNKDK